MDPRNSATAAQPVWGRQGQWSGKGQKEHTARQKKKNIHGERAQEEDEILAGTVACGGALTDSEWHVVFSSSPQASVAIQPCAHHALLHHRDILHHTDTLPTDSWKTKKNMSHRLLFLFWSRDCLSQLLILLVHVELLVKKERSPNFLATKVEFSANRHWVYLKHIVFVPN